MPIEIVTPDGEIAEFPDGTDDATISRAMRQLDQERDARTRAGANGPGGGVGAMVGRMARPDSPTMRAPAAQAYQRRARERAPQGRPGTLLRGLEDFNRNGPAGLMNQMWRNVGIADEAAAGSEFLRSGGNADAAAGGAQFERDQQAQVAREQPGLNAAAIGASIPALGGLSVPGRVSALRAGVGAAAVNSPFALARQEGSLQERLPGAALETGAVFGLGAGLQGLANRLTAPARAGTGRSRAADFEAAGVRPTQAAVSGGAPAGLTRMISENFIAGAPARGRLAASLDDTAQRARGIAGEFGQHGQPENVGESVQRGIERFSRSAASAPRSGRPETISTREWSFRSKANALYDDVFGRIAADERGHLTGQTGVTATADATRETLTELQSRVQAPNLADMMRDPTIARIASALDADQGALRFNDLRELRTWVRQQRARPALTQTVDEAALARLEGALTQDIYHSAIEIGGEAAAQQLRRVDQFYRAGNRRIQEVLQPFADRSGRGAYDRVVALAREGGRQNTRSLQSLRNSLRPDEWREVAATVIDDLGRPTTGNPNALEPGSFSVEQFVTNYAKLSTEGRRILFGGAQTQSLADALDLLARVAGYQKGVERMVNASRSGVNVQNFGSLAGLANPGTTLPTAGLLAGMALTGEMLTNPAFVRWLASASKNGGPSGMRRHIAALAQIAARDPAVAPVHAELVRRAGDQFQLRQDQPPARRELVQ